MMISELFEKAPEVGQSFEVDHITLNLLKKTTSFLQQT